MPSFHSAQEARIDPSILAIIFLVCILLLAMVNIVPRTFAADDSNSGQLLQSSQQTLDFQQLNSTLGTLSQGLNNTEVSQLVSQLRSQIASGNTTAQASTLSQLKNVTSTPSGQEGVPNSLQDLLKSLYAGPNGLTIDPKLLAKLLGADNTGSTGMPSGLSKDDPQQAASELKSLASLLQYIDPNLAQQLMSEGNSLSQTNGLPQNDNSSATPTTSSSSPSLGNGFSAPKVSPPALSLPSVLAGLPSLNVFAIALPVILAAAGIGLYFSRRRVAHLLGSQALRGRPLSEDIRVAEYDPSDPRKRIIHYFTRAVHVMRLRGVSKLSSETHREFSTKCVGSREEGNVSRISELYEKAKFSGKEVAHVEADVAAKELGVMESR